MTDYRVIAIEDCQRCHAHGYLEHPWWTDYRRTHTKAFLPTVTTYPPEEIPCPDCQAAGTIRREIPLIEALRQLNIRPQTNVRGPFIRSFPSPLQKGVPS